MSDFRDLYTSKIDTIEDLFKHLNPIPNELTFWRGQSDSEWFITSSFFRFYEKLKGESFLIKNVEELVKRKQYSFDNDYFKLSRKIIIDLQKELNKIENYKFSFKETLYLAQHYGLPTNLIDFTLNPYIALYFAFSSNSRPGNGYVSVFRTAPFKFYKIMWYGIKRTYFVNEKDMFEEFTTLKPNDHSFKIPKKGCYR